MDQPDCEIAALCDVYEPYIMRDRSKVDPRYIKDMPGQIPKMDEVFPSKVERYSDYRKLLENKSIDAVCIATPDHWHAIMTIDAIKAGKDVYIEKPLSKTIHEGRAMVNAGKNSNRIVTVGLNRRSAPSFQKLAMRPNHQHYNLLTVLLLQEGQTYTMQYTSKIKIICYFQEAGFLQITDAIGRDIPIIRTFTPDYHTVIGVIE